MAAASSRHIEPLLPSGGTAQALAGSSDGTSSTTGALSVTHKLIGTTTGTSTTSGALKASHSLAGITTGTTTTSGSLKVAHTLAGTTTGTASASAALTVTSPVPVPTAAGDRGTLQPPYRFPDIHGRAVSIRVAYASTTGEITGTTRSHRPTQHTSIGSSRVLARVRSRRTAETRLTAHVESAARQITEDPDLELAVAFMLLAPAGAPT